MQNLEESKGTKVFQLRGDNCTCGICFYQCTDVISLIVHKSQHAIAENVYRCELCRCLHSSQEQLCSHYVDDHKVVMLFIPDDKVSGLETETIAVVSTDERSIETFEMVEESHLDGTELKNNNSLVFNSSDVKSVHIEVTQEPEPVKLQTIQSLNFSTGFETEASIASAASGNTKQKVSKYSAEEDKLKFLLVTECSASCSRPYLKTWFLCLYCSYKTRTRVAFQKHMKTVHKRLKHLESIVESDVVDRSGVKDGKPDDVTFGSNLMTMADYDNFVPVVTTKSKSSDTSKKNVRRLEKQDILGSFPCKSCSKEFSRLRYLRRHLITHKDDKPHICTDCKKSYKTNDQLKAHRKACSKPDKLYECPQCDFKSKINSVIHAHRQLHPDGCIICDVCGKAYADKSTLMKHMQVHDPQRPFACTVIGCMWRFKSEVMFRAHLRAHSTKGKFLCNYCGYAFRHKHHLLRHQSSMHGIDPPKTRPYGQVMKEEVERDMVEIPADQLEIHETAFLDQPIFMTGEPDSIISEPTDLSSINTLIQTHVIYQQDCDLTFGQKDTKS